MAELTYFKKFDIKSDYDSYITGDPVLPNVSIVANEDVYFTDGDGPEPTHDYSQDYLTFNIISGGTIYAEFNNMVNEVAILKYSINNGYTWIEVEESPTEINVSDGNKIMFKSDNCSICFAGSTPLFEVEGNIMSLVNSTDFITATTLPNGWTYCDMFRGCTGLTSAENLILPASSILTQDYYEGMFMDCTSLVAAPELPATTLAEGCYLNMFSGCRRLTTTPSLPATTLANSCYANMFEDCTSLTTAPSILPATTLTEACYDSMFAGCTSLTTAPSLPATTLAYECYQHMFEHCESLNYIKCLATDISASDCTYSWVDSVAETGIFDKSPDMNDWQTGTSGIPDGWDVQDA